MKLDQKYFVPFMLGCGLISLVIIVISSFNFQHRQADRFQERAMGNEDLLSQSHPYINQDDSLRLQELTGKQVLLLFWASWSEKSEELMQEVDVLLDESDDIEVIAALVMSAKEEAMEELPAHSFTYIDGTRLFNQLQVPGIPSYMILDRNGRVLYTHVGYQSGADEVIRKQLGG